MREIISHSQGGPGVSPEGQGCLPEVTVLKSGHTGTRGSPWPGEIGSVLEESTYLTSGSTTKPQLSRQYGTGTKTEI